MASLQGRTRYKVLKSLKQVNRLIKVIKKVGVCAVDFETNGYPLHNNAFRPTILSITYQAGQGLTLPLAHDDSPLKDIWLQALTLFGRAIIENPTITKMAWNWKYDNQIFHHYGIYSRGTVIDGMLAKYILNEERPNGLKDMVDRYLPEFSGYEEASGFDKIPWDQKPFEPLCLYGSTDTDMTFRLCTFFEQKLIENGFYNLYRNLMMAASQVLQSVEYHGLEFNKELNRALKVKYTDLVETTTQQLLALPRVKRYCLTVQKEKKARYIAKLEDEIKELKSEEGKARQIATREAKIERVLVGDYQTKEEKALEEHFNFGSVKQLSDLMYLHPKGFNYPILAYTKDKKTKKASSNPSTAEDVLLQLQADDKYGFIDKLLELRGLTHTLSSFIEGYTELVQEDGRIHPKFNLHTTVTGRLSSTGPNAQQIPKMEVNKDIKPQFIAPPGKLFFAYDYSQAELRIMAHLSGDPILLEAFRLGQDPHLAVACKKYSYDYDQAYAIYSDETHPEYKLWKVRRKQAKQIVFGCIYGIEAKKLSEQLSDIKSNLIVTPEEAQQFLDEFFEEHPKVKRFMEKQTKHMEKHGYVTTLFGRRRRCPKIYSDNYGEYLEARRASFNAPCQSCASDFALYASVLIYQRVKAGTLPQLVEVSTVHDALYHYTDPTFLNPWVVYQLYEICRNPDTSVFGFTVDDVDMEMDFSVGRHMGEELPYTPGYDYQKLLEPDFDLEQYYHLHSKYKGVPIKDYPKVFPEYFTDEFVKAFRKHYTKRFNNGE